MALPHESPKHPLYPIAPDRIPKSFSNDDANAGRGIVHSAGHKIEQFRRKPPTVALDRFNIPACPKKNTPLPLPL